MHCKFDLVLCYWVSYDLILVLICYLRPHSDPQVQKDFVDALYDGGPFLRSLPNAISADGILVAQVGEAPVINSPPEESSLSRNRMKFIQSLADLGFQSIFDYEEVTNNQYCEETDFLDGEW